MKAFNNNFGEKVNIKKTVDKNKTGIKFLHSLYTSRFKTKLLIPIILESIACICESIALIYFGIFDESIKTLISEENVLYFTFIVIVACMVFSNVSRIITNFYEDCDHAMLSFKAYRTRKVIVSLFKERLIYLVKLNIIPVIIMVIGFFVVKYINYGMKFNISLIFTCISAFFITISSIMFNLLLFYIFQPYSYNERLKKASINNFFIMFFSMMFCIFIYIMGFFIFESIIINNIIIIIYTIIIVCMSIFLVNKLAPITFKRK